MMKGIRSTAFLLVSAAIFLAGCAHHGQRTDTLYQASTIDALMEGVYDGTTSFGELRKNGDFGIGTFHALDGEMIGLDGVFYQVKADGTVLPVPDDARTPFAVVKFFSPGKTFTISGSRDLDALMRELDALLPTRNSFYAIRIEGTFPLIKARSVPAQRKPYPGLGEAVKNQSVFEFSDIRGAIIGFRSPDFVRGINLPGYHFHFISGDRKAGGHLLGCRIENASVALDETGDFHLALPTSDEFRHSDLGRDHRRELDKAER
jgi:acetolactate decarboxylase